MMDIVLFGDITTESSLTELEALSEKYTDLYCDMNNKDERKFVKDKAANIESIRKKLSRARIDKSKEFKIKVDQEARSIDDRLIEANKPFSILIDSYKAERANILAKEKAVKDAADLIIQIEFDHEYAITEDKLRTFEKKEKAAEQEKRDDELVKKGIDDAIKSAKLKKDRELEEAAQRACDIEHVTATCKTAKESLMKHAGITESQAVAVVKAIRNNLIKSVTINF